MSSSEMLKDLFVVISFFIWLVVSIVESMSDVSCSRPGLGLFIAVAGILWLGVYEMIPTKTKHLGNPRELFRLLLAMVILIGSFSECI